jgi:hypothetical protein
VFLWGGRGVQLDGVFVKRGGRWGRHNDRLPLCLMTLHTVLLHLALPWTKHPPVLTHAALCV